MARDQAYSLGGWLHLKYVAATVFNSPHHVVTDLRRAGAAQADPAPQTPDPTWEPPEWPDPGVRSRG